MRSTFFDTPLTMYSGEEAGAMLEAAGYTVEQHYGLLGVTSYWGDNERKRDPAIYAQLEELELALTDKSIQAAGKVLPVDRPQRVSAVRINLLEVRRRARHRGGWL